MEKQKLSGVYYSNNPDPQVDELLKEQHRLTIKTAVSAFIENDDSFRPLLEEWAERVARSRVENNIPIHEVIEALNKTRETIWYFLERFCKEHAKSVTNEYILHWSVVYNTTFDLLIYQFSKRYYTLSNNRLIAQQSLILELGAPIIPILPKVAILPIVGDIDTFRAKNLLEEIPQKCVQLGLETLFIDISGVFIIDTMVANELFKLTDILQLLGIQPVLSGIRPEVAQTTIHLGINFGSLKTYSSLQQALKITNVYGNT